MYNHSYALYSSLSPYFQKYLEQLTAVHSAAAQAQGARAAGTHVRRHEVETIHPVVRVHPVTGWKSVFVNPGTSKKHLSKIGYLTTLHRDDRLYSSHRWRTQAGIRCHLDVPLPPDQRES